MDKRIIIGVVAGLVFGILEMLIFQRGFGLPIIGLITGGLIGFASTKSLPVPFLAASAIIGAVLFIIVGLGAYGAEGMSSSIILHDIVMGGITGLLIGFIAQFIGQKMT